MRRIDDLLGDMAAKSRSRALTAEQRAQRRADRLAQHAAKQRAARALQRAQRVEQLDGGVNYPRGFKCEPGSFEPLYQAFREPHL